MEKKIIRLTESQLEKVIRKIIKEQQVEGRNFQVNPDGTISIQDHKGNMAKVRVSLKTFGNVNITKLQKDQEDYKLTSKSGKVTKIAKDIVSKIINFIDGRGTSEIETGFAKPNIILSKL